MNLRGARVAMPMLRWTIAAVVILESVQFVLSASAGHLMAKMGVPGWVRPTLGIGEIFAATLFLMPKTTIVGGYCLLVVFALAALLHLLHGQFGVEGLVVYAACVFACMAQGGKGTAEASSE